MDAAGMLLGVLASVPSAFPWLGGGYAAPAAAAAFATILALTAGTLIWWRWRRTPTLRPAPPAGPVTALKQRLRRRLATPLEPFAPFAAPGPTVGASEVAEADLDAAATTILPAVGWRGAIAKHALRSRLGGSGSAGREAASWRQLGALALLDDMDEALAAYTQAADLSPDDADLQLLVGFLYLRTGRLEPAEAMFRRQLKPREGGQGSESAGGTESPEAAPGQGAVKYRAGIMLGDVLLAKGDRDAALEAYRTACAEVVALAEREPGNLRRQRDASVAHDRIGDLLLADAQPQAALDCFRKSLEICKAAAEAEPANPALQHDLSVVHDRVGEALALQGDLNGALESYSHGLALAEAAASLAPACAEWRWDVAASHDRVGDTLSAMGRLPEALAAYRRGLQISVALAEAEPTRLDWQRDLAASLHKTGLLEAQLGREAEAREALEQGRAIVARLAEVARHRPQWQADLATFNAALKALGP